MRKLEIVVVSMIAAAVSTAGAQRAGEIYAKPAAQAGDSIIVKTVPLHHLSSAEAMKLLSPYVRNPMVGGVYETPSIRAVTIRETQKNYNEMLAVLAKYDREPATITLNFQLLAGYSCDSCARRSGADGAALVGLDSLLRGVLKYNRYRVLANATVVASEGGYIVQSISAEGDPMTLTVSVTDVRVDGSSDNGPMIVIDGVTQPSPSAAASVHLNIALNRDIIMARGSTPGRSPSQVLSTGVTVPIGQTIVLGASAGLISTDAAAMSARVRAGLEPAPAKAVPGTEGALILAVRPLIGVGKR